MGASTNLRRFRQQVRNVNDLDWQRFRMTS
jgi:hypothetical protein